MMMEPLWPPNPKLFDMAGAGVHVRADPITRSIPAPSSSRTVARRRRDGPVLHRQQHRRGFQSSGGSERVSGDTLDTGDDRSVFAEDRADRGGLGFVVARRRCAVRVHVGDLGR